MPPPAFYVPSFQAKKHFRNVIMFFFSKKSLHKFYTFFFFFFEK